MEIKQISSEINTRPFLAICGDNDKKWRGGAYWTHRFDTKEEVTDFAGGRSHEFDWFEVVDLSSGWTIKGSERYGK